MSTTSDQPRKNARSATDLDRVIGRRLRAIRQLKKLSQEQLGEMVGVTFQQIQKYERGTNRIAGSRLWAISESLEVHITYFFPSDGDEAFDELLADLNLPADLNAGIARQVLKSLNNAKPNVRRKMVEVIKAVGGDD